MSSMPVSLIIATSLLFAFAHAQHEHSQNIQEGSRRYLSALIISSFFGYATLTGVCIYYFFQVAWYWPILLFFLSGAIGSVLLPIFGSFLEEFRFTMIAFIGWPASAAWAIYIIHGLPP